MKKPDYMIDYRTFDAGAYQTAMELRFIRKGEPHALNTGSHGARSNDVRSTVYVQCEAQAVANRFAKFDMAARTPESVASLLVSLPLTVSPSIKSS